ncbi:AAA family ATPase [Hyphomicrobium sp. MC1]|uniref:AAA family ATPase n=1 Tax=Hyphomicrobium sp. (strain MC1) TaxID=717785 RepID=UPI000213EACD|nr:AAA family ATPase [Hyphomicrobium sp. MC1]CCB64068.1 putative Phage-related Holin protein [Hyphomicrobium sp. MC1]
MAKPPRLKSLPPRLATLPSRLSAAPKPAATRQERERNRLNEREGAVACRAWYHSSRWQRLRLEIFKRDLYVCQATGIILGGTHPAPNSPVCDHKIPHNGDPELFWSPSNLWTVSKHFHDSKKQALEKGDQTAAIHPKWLSPSIIPLTIVCGPPASGKSTYVRQHAGSKDLVIDLDVIASQISGEPQHAWDRTRWLNAALYFRNDMIGGLSRPSDYEVAWLIVAEPNANHRQFWATALQPQRIVVLETDAATCLANAGRDEGRDLERTQAVVSAWWQDYERRTGDERIAWPWPTP